MKRFLTICTMLVLIMSEASLTQAACIMDRITDRGTPPYRPSTDIYFDNTGGPNDGQLLGSVYPIPPDPFPPGDQREFHLNVVYAYSFSNTTIDTFNDRTGDGPLGLVFGDPEQFFLDMSGNVPIYYNGNPSGQTADWTITGIWGAYKHTILSGDIVAGYLKVYPQVYRSFAGYPNVYEIFDGALLTTEVRGYTLSYPDPNTGKLQVDIAPPPVGSSTNTGGDVKDVYSINETVYASGNDFAASTNVDIYIVGDRTWTDGMAIPPDVSSDGMNTVLTDGAGDLGPANVWPPSLTLGGYDMVFDANQNGTYDAYTDVVCDPNHPGFSVMGGGGAVGGTASMANKFELLVPWIALSVLMLLTIGIVASRKFRKKFEK